MDASQTQRDARAARRSARTGDGSKGQGDPDDAEGGGRGNGLTPVAVTARLSVLERHFLEQLKRGIVPSREALKTFCAARGLSLPSRSKLRRLRYQWRVSAVFSRWQKPQAWMGASIWKPGVIQVDVAYFMKRHLVQNQQRKYFFCAVDCLSGKLGVVAMVTKNRSDWQRALLFLLTSGQMEISHVLSDRDGAVTSKAFRKQLRDRYGIGWSFLYSRSHAFRSERMISYCKSKLAMALGFNEKGDFCWTRHVESVVSHYNSQLIDGTNIVRNSVNKQNYGSLLEQLRGSNDPWMLHNISTSRNFSPWLKARLWKFREGQKVLLARQADYEAKGQQTKQGGSFFKRSVEGSWAPKVRTITQLWLKDSKFFVTPTYSLQGLNGKFYENEILPADFAK